MDNLSGLCESSREDYDTIGKKLKRNITEWVQTMVNMLLLLLLLILLPQMFEMS